MPHALQYLVAGGNIITVWQIQEHIEKKEIILDRDEKCYLSMLFQGKCANIVLKKG